MALTQFLPQFVTLVLLYWIYRTFGRSKGIPLPPGPPRDPLIGHLRIFMHGVQEETYYTWHKQYGDVMYFNVSGKQIIYLNSESAARELLDKRGAKYSDRPLFPAYELIGWKDLLAFLPYGGEFQKTRKLFQEALSRSGVLVFREMQQHQANILLKNLLSSPEIFDEHLKRFAYSIILEVAYGRRIEAKNDPYMKITEDLVRAMDGTGDPGATMLDFFPILGYLPAWFPVFGVMGHCKRFRPVIQRSMDIPFDEVRQKLAKGNAETSFLSMALEKLQMEGRETQEELYRLKGSSHQLFAAGGDTTWSTLEVTFLALLLHPHVQQKAQKEIDEVIGQTRLPNFGDRKDLPYLECVIQESMRWHPVVPLGVPHRVMEADVYQRMYIPKGATIIANTRCITMDENVYQNPRVFLPERYLAKPEGNGEPFSGSAFGFGRRICPGKHLAEDSVWIVIASILATFDILPAKDENGSTTFPKAEFYGALTSRPVPFRCKIQPRSAGTRALIEEIKL